MSLPDPASITADEGPGDIDPIAAFSALEDTTRANIIGTIVGHPKEAPSKKEIEYYNPSVAPSTLSGHLEKLEEVRLIEAVEREREGLARGEPYRFFRLTDVARELFDRNNLYEPAAYRSLFDEVEKTDEIRAAETVERPPVDS
jgi:DNA-binding transcriptional ArsR family regulator